MKSTLSIVLSMLILLGGLQIHQATHFCGGRYVSAKFSLSGEKAGCGMEECTIKQSKPGESYKKNCCKDLISVFSLNVYQVNLFSDILIPEKKITQLGESPVPASNIHPLFIQTTYSVVKPPGVYLHEFTSSEFLCVFLI